jgi:hypothetical protein
MGGGADADPLPELPPEIVDDDADSEQLTLWAAAIPAHPLDPAEADLRRWANRPRGRSHWWLRERDDLIDERFGDRSAGATIAGTAA